MALSSILPPASFGIPIFRGVKFDEVDGGVLFVFAWPWRRCTGRICSEEERYDLRQVQATLSLLHSRDGSADGARIAAVGTRDISSGISGVTEATQRTGTASREVLSAMEALSAQSEAMQARVKEFLGAIQAA
jgi:hypothetical protein